MDARPPGVGEARPTMHRSRKFITTSVLAVMATTFAGCFSFVKEDSASQTQPMADVNVETTSCASPLIGLIIAGQGGVEGVDDLCVAKDDATELYYERFAEFVVPMPGQVLLAYRVPKGTQAPEQLTASTEIVHFKDWWEYLDGTSEPRGTGTGTGTTGGGELPENRQIDVTFTRSAELDEKLPAFYSRTDDDDPANDEDHIDLLDEDQEVVAYVSDVVPGAQVGEWTVKAGFGLPAEQRPFEGPFNHVSMVGWRAVMTPELEPPVRSRRALESAGLISRGIGGMFGDLDPEREIDCRLGETIPTVPAARRALRGEEPDPVDLTFCPMPKPQIGDGEENPVLGIGRRAFKGTDTATRDLGLRGGGETFVEQGRKATVPYSLVGSGPAGGELELTAKVVPAIPGVGDVATEVEFPGAGTHGRSLELQIPADAPARTYEVLFTAKNGDHTRTAKAGLVVLPKAATAEQAAQPEQQQPQGTVAVKKTRRPTVFMDREGFIRFSSACGPCSVDGLVPFGTVGDSGAKASQSTGTHRLLRVARGKVAGKSGVRTKVRVKLFPKAQRALRSGRRLTGVIVFRKGAGGRPDVRKVVFRARR